MMVAIPASLPPLRVCPCEVTTLFGRFAHAVYCSKPCASRFWRLAMRAEFPIPKLSRVCPMCKRDFSQQRRDQTYCSPHCRELAHGDRRRRKTNAPTDGVTRCCKICDLEFVSRRWNQVYCCKACKLHVINQRRTIRKTDREPFPSPALIRRRCKAIQQQRARNGEATTETAKSQRTEVSADADSNSDRLRPCATAMDA